MNAWKRFGGLYWGLLVLVVIAVMYQNRPQTLVSPTLDASDKVACVSYAPYYQKGQSPFKKGMMVDHAQIDADLAKLSKLTHCVRTYSVGQGLDYVPEAASKLGMKVLLGAWIGWTEADNQHEIAVAVERANRYPDTVKALIIGNEVLLRREQTMQKMRTYLNLARKNTHIPVTYADVWEFWLKYRGLEQDVDFVTVHILPYWEDIPVPIASGVAHAEEVMQKLDQVFHKPMLIGETGWPSAGRERSGSVPSVVNEARYIREFLQAAHHNKWQYNLIEAVDQPWKRELEGTVGGYWGLFDTQLNPKFALRGPVNERHDGAGLLWVMAIAMALGLAVSSVSVRALRVQGAGASDMFWATSGYMALSLLTGAYAYFSWDYLSVACRDPLEWIALGSIVLIAGVLVTLVLRGVAQSNVNKPMFWFGFYLLFTAAVASGLILLDGRYRNFPTCLYGWPMMLLLMGWPKRQPCLVSAQQKNLALLVGGVGILCSAGILVVEPKTHAAYGWFLTQILLSVGVCLSARKR